MLLPLLLGQGTGGPAAYTLDAEVGAFTLTGQAATLQTGRVLNAASTSYTITGQAATLSVGRALNLASTSFSISGQAATLTKTVTPLNAASASFALTGQDVTFDRTFAARELDAQPGAFDILGQPASFLRTYLFNAEAAAYTDSPYVDPDYVAPDYVGAPGAVLSVGRILNSSPGIYVLTGQDAELTKTSIFPAPEDVRVGVTYGPGGIYSGTLVVGSGGGMVFLRRR